jgi:hypothetical protein
MSFWTNSEVTPKRNFRFLVQITGIDDPEKDTLWWAKTMKLPSVSFGEVEHNFLDNKYYYPGRATWDEVNMTLVDPVSPDATAIMHKLIMGQGYNVKSNLNDRNTISKKKSSGINGVQSVIIQVLDDEGTNIETWTLKNAFIKSISYSDLDYSSDELRQIDVSLRYDYAECLTKSGNSTDGTYYQAGTTKKK